MIPKPTASKLEWRQYCLLQLGRVMQTEIKANMICKRLLSLPKLINSQRILCYYPLPNEVDISEFTHTLMNSGKEVFLPFFHKQGIGRYSQSMHYERKLKAYEPKSESQDIQLDVVLIPGLAFDENGYRMGRGQGWYDRFLNELDILKIGIIYDELVFSDLPHESHDVKVDMVITPQKVLTVKRL